MRTPFLGAHYVARSKNLADQLCINLYPELVDTKSGKDVGALFMTPGLDLITTCGSGPIRAIYPFSNGQLAYVVSGGDVYSLNAAFTATRLGPLTTPTLTGPVSIIDNGTQAAIIDGQGATLITAASGALASITMPMTGPVIAAEQDGFGVANQRGSVNWFQSNFGDLSTWPALNFGAAAGKPDPIVAIGNVHREMWLIKETNTEIWINAGLSGFAFQREDGVFIEVGCAAPHSVKKVGESLIWLARNSDGQNTVVRSKGYQIERISTHSLEFELASYSTVSDAIGYSYQQEGHTFYLLILPTANKTWAWDAATGLWHQRAAFENGQFNRHWVNCGAFFNGRNLIGDYRNGRIYAFNLDTLTDADTRRRWLRTWRALPKPTMSPTRFPSLQIDMQTGATQVPAGTDPQAVLRFSDDDGHTWSNERIAAVGPTGMTAQRVKFNRLGSTRRTTGLDRILELSSSDPFKVALIGAEFLEQ